VSFARNVAARLVPIRSEPDVCSGIVHEASLFNVKTEEYPLTRRLFFYTSGEPAPGLAAEFVSSH
jgi:ABC-type phosphate transport system substrate-binding protein